MLSVRVVKGWQRFRIESVLLVPGIAANLLAVSRIEERGCSITLTRNTCTIRKPSESGPLLRVRKNNDTYKIMAIPDDDGEASGGLLSVEKKRDAGGDMWHARLGHVGLDLVNRILEDQGLRSTQENTIDTKNAEQRCCNGCLKGKTNRATFKNGT